MGSQHTISESVTVSGRGLFGGEPVTVCFHPAPANHGVVFVRADLDHARIPALVRYVTNTPRRTSLKNGVARVETCEHCLSALGGLGIDNAVVELDGPELPALDGSAQPYLDALFRAGLCSNDEPRESLAVDEPVMVQENGAAIAAMPSEDNRLEVVYSLDYPDPIVGRQVRTLRFSPQSYRQEIAPARTFVMEEEARVLQQEGAGTHLSPEEMLVIGPRGPLGGNAFRFEDEPARHKILDLLGDLSLLGMPITGRIVASRSGHELNHALVRRLLAQVRDRENRHVASMHEVLDNRRLSQILPHRYPMLLVDRVLELEGSHWAKGVKNVTVNEPFFQGHYPGTPIMPGVLIVEAMAQLAGVLIGQNLEHKGKLPVLLSLDGVKLRKPVTPGDQLILEAEAVRVRRRIAHMACRAHLGPDTAAEASVKFMLVDEEDNDDSPA